MSQSRRLEGRAACYTLLTAKHEVGSGAIMTAMALYLDFLFTQWGIRARNETVFRNSSGR